MASWLADAALRARIGEQGRRVVEQNRGALERLIAPVEARLAAAGLGDPAARPEADPPQQR
jgi:3-deoxy-D-manno-octulosonic-acid transferase